MTVIIRYYSEKKDKFFSAFADLIPLLKATGEDIFEAMNKCIEGIGLIMKDCIVLGYDGTSVMVGEHNSIWWRMKAVASNCIVLNALY